MRSPLVVLFAICATPQLASAQAARSSDEASRVLVASSVRPLFDDGLSIGPGAYTLRYEYAERWRAGVGGEIVLVGVEGPPGALGLTLGGLLALDNENGRAPVPYQMLRAVIGLGVRAATRRRAIDGEHDYRISAELAYTHESDHPSGTSAVAWELERYVSLDDFSSFEHLRLAGHYEHWFRERLWFSLGAALRLYPPPINPLAGRQQRVAFEVELRLWVHLHGALRAFAAFYVEGVGHELDPATVGRVTLPSLLSVVRAELGLSLGTEGHGRIHLYAGVVEEDGQGIDFVRHYGPAFVSGIRGSL